MKKQILILFLLVLIFSSWSQKSVTTDGPCTDAMVYKTANRKLQLLVELGTDQLLRIDRKIQMAIDSVRVWRDAYSEAGKNPTNCHNPDGTIDEDCLKRYCAKRKAEAVTFFNSANTLWHQVNFEVLTLHKEYVTAYVRLLLYT